MKKFLIIFLFFLSLFLIISCQPSKDTEKADVYLPAQKTTSGSFTVVWADGSMLEDPSAKAKIMDQVHKGDELQIQKKQAEWVKVLVTSTGKIGWINEALIKNQKANPFWSGDTEKAREIAKKIYQDKRMNYPPIKHVRIEERWQTLNFVLDEEAAYPLERAQQLSKICFPLLKELSPNWSSGKVIIHGFDGEKTYNLSYDGISEPVIF